ncbi:hypothetical protein Ancab_004654, partial [Ancistrocladus abbreviatus]
ETSKGEEIRETANTEELFDLYHGRKLQPSGFKAFSELRNQLVAALICEIFCS